MESLKPEDPSRIGPFVPLARIGAGGMGRVYLARSRGGRPVAVKVIKAEYAEDERFRIRFRREVEAARTVGGLYTAPVLDAGPDDAAPWLATAYIPGPSLQRVIHDHGPLPEHSVRVLGAGIAEALGAIHSAGLIHRDLKPSNVICGPDGPRVIDFGISHSVDAAATNLTTTGVVVGSPRYASPEQCRVDAQMQPASDVFALGGVLTFAATGVPPFGDGPDHVQLYLVVYEAPDLTGVPMGLRPIVTACLEKDPANRPSVDELLDTLLPPDEAGLGGAGGAADWLPEAVHQDLRKFEAAPVGGGTGGSAGIGGSNGHDLSSTHERPGYDPVRTPAPPAAVGTIHGMAGVADRETDAGSGGLTRPPASKPAQASTPTRRRLLTGLAGVVAMGASGGGAWYAATRNDKKKTAENAGAEVPTTATSQNPAGSASAPAPATSSTPPPAPHPTGEWGQDWTSSTDLGGGGSGAVVHGDKLIGVYTAKSTTNPNPPQNLIAFNTATGGPAWQPQVIPALEAVISIGIAVDDQYIYTYGQGTIYAWNLSDGKQAWSKKNVLKLTGQEYSLISTGILSLADGVLLIGSNALSNDTNLTQLAGVDVKTQTVLWTHKFSDLLASLPSEVTRNQVQINVTGSTGSAQFFLTISDSTSMRLLKGMDLRTGQEQWHALFAHHEDGGEGTYMPTVTGTATHVYLTDMYSGSVHTYDLAGNWKWTYPTPPAAKQAPVAPEMRFSGPVVEADGVVYATNANSVVALDATSAQTSGKTLWQKPKQFNGLAGGGAAVVGDKIWVEVHTPLAKQPLAIAILDRSDGHLVTQYAMPEGPTASSADVLVPDPAGTGCYVLAASGQVLGYRRTQ